MPEAVRNNSQFDWHLNQKILSPLTLASYLYIQEPLHLIATKIVLENPTVPPAVFAKTFATTRPHATPPFKSKVLGKTIVLCVLCILIFFCGKQQVKWENGE